VIRELEGDEGENHIEEYADRRTERGKCLLRSICEEMGFDTLGFQSLDGMLEAIGIDRKLVCTYCWSGRE
jgi:amidophosphoribosyltransferase